MFSERCVVIGEHFPFLPILRSRQYAKILKRRGQVCDEIVYVAYKGIFKYMENSRYGFRARLLLCCIPKTKSRSLQQRTILGWVD